MELTNQQKEILSDWLDHYIKNEEEDLVAFDQTRINALPELRLMVKNFLTGTTTINEFKEQSERLCRTYGFWGFKGMSGQMQLNQFVNGIQDEGKVDVIRKAITLPQSVSEAKKRLMYSLSIFRHNGIYLKIVKPYQGLRRSHLYFLIFGKFKSQKNSPFITAAPSWF